MLTRILDWFRSLSSTKKFFVLVAAVLVLALLVGARTALFNRAQKMPALSMDQRVGIRLIGQCEDGRVIAVMFFDVNKDGEPDFAAFYASDRPDAPFVVLERKNDKVYIDRNRDGIVDRIVLLNDPIMQRTPCDFLGRDDVPEQNG